MMDFLLFASLFLMFGSIINVAAMRWFGFENRYLGLLTGALVFRLLLCYFYYFYFLDKPADATRYYSYAVNSGLSLSGLLSPGTVFIKNVAALFYDLMPKLPNDYLMLYIPFGLCGHIGSLIFFAVCECFPSVSSRVRAIIPFFLPNLIFWTSNLGKDSIIYLGLMMVIYGFLVFPGVVVKRLPWMVPGFILVLSIRPHIAAILLLALLFGILTRFVRMDGRTIALTVIISIGFYLSYERVLDFVGLKIEVEEGEDAVDTMGDIYEQSMKNIQTRAGSLNYGGAAAQKTPISLLKAPVYFINFIGGPFLWLARKPMQVTAAFESLIYQFLILYITRYWAFFRRHAGVEYKYAWVFFVILGSFILGMSYTNFGLTIRQKCMVIPPLLIIYLIVASERATDKISHETAVPEHGQPA